MIAKRLQEQSKKLPKKPGVYLFKDSEGRVLYVGKAKDLRSRVRQYLLGQDSRLHVGLMLRKAVDVEIALTPTEKEALLLENTLIKRHSPRYNLQLKDDKNFLHIVLDMDKEWPHFELVRRIQKSRNWRTFGPFDSAQKARKTLAFVERNFPLRTCSDRTLKSRKRPCILHQMEKCVGPCVDGLTTQEEYSELVQDAVLFLEGRHQELLSTLRGKMQEASTQEDFEKAAGLRDLIQGIESTLQKQSVVDTALADRDIWGLWRDADAGVLLFLPVRAGMMLEPVGFPFSKSLQGDAEIVSSGLLQFYSSHALPREVLIPFSLPEQPVLEELLSAQRNGAFRLHVPKRGSKARLVELANQNAEARYRQRENKKERLEMALESLAKKCGLVGPPRRIECFDNSNFQGHSPVASQVVFLNGVPAKKLYRRYHIRGVEGPDDYASMEEVLGRRIRRAWLEDDFPDLIVVDGGVGQLSAALKVLKNHGSEGLAVVGLAKARTEKRRGAVGAVDKILIPGRSEPLILKDTDPALNLLRHLRDESHRFAVSFHRKTRKKASLYSELDAIQGLGPMRKKALLKHFGSLKAIREATSTDIAALKGFSLDLAQRIVSGLKRPD
jgi:excinuclease ABC subunit C